MSNGVPAGRVYRRCACRGEDGRQLGKSCPQLTDNSKHGTWYYAIDVPTLDGKRKTKRRGGFATQKAAKTALQDVRDKYALGVQDDDRQKVADYLAGWLADQERVLKPKTMLNYRRYVENDIVPALGVYPLERLHHDHVRRFVAELEDAGRGAVTVRRILAVLASAMSDAVEQRRITHSPVEHVRLAPVRSVEREPWNAAELVRFFESAEGDQFAELFEVIAGCGLRRGEALALRWSDVDLDGRLMYVRSTLSEVGGRLVISQPKTKKSADWVGLSRRVVEALKVQRARQAMDRAEWGEDYEDRGLVFARENGAPLRPEQVLRRFHAITERAGLRKIRLHDLRHGAATLLLSEGVPLPIVSKMLRHSQVGITADTYGHLRPDVALEAADAMDAALEAAAAEWRNERAATTARSQSGVGDHVERVESTSQGPGNGKTPWSKGVLE